MRPFCSVPAGVPLALALILAVAVPAVVEAQDPGVEFEFTPVIGAYFAPLPRIDEEGSELRQETDVSLGVRGTLWLARGWGGGLEFHYAPGETRRRSTTGTGGFSSSPSDLIVGAATVVRRWYLTDPLQLRLQGGLLVLDHHGHPATTWHDTLGTTDFGILLGGGFHLALSDWAGIRLDVQDHLFRSQFEFVERGVETEARLQSDVLVTLGLSLGGQ